MRYLKYFVLWALVLCVACPAWLTAGNKLRARAKRAQTPDWTKRRNADPFFTDAFIEALTGNRPEGLGIVRKSSNSGQPLPDPGGDPQSSSGYAWSKIISASTIEDEIKGIKISLDKTITVPGKYVSGGNREGRRQFSMLALLFAIIVDYDGEVRWRRDAATARDRFARAGFNSKVGTPNSFKEAKARRDDLQDLVGGGQLASVSPDADVTWEKVSDRPPLMQRFELAEQERLSPWTASKEAFIRQRDQIQHEAEIVAALAQVIQQDGFEYADDDDYLDYCKQIQRAALEIINAVKLNNYEAARQATGEIQKSCSACHEDFRA